LADQARKAAADAQFKKLQRVADGKQAMSEYQAEQAAINERTARLKAERLAREEAAEKAPPQSVEKPRARRKLTRA